MNKLKITKIYFDNRADYKRRERRPKSRWFDKCVKVQNMQESVIGNKKAAKERFGNKY